MMSLVGSILFTSENGVGLEAVLQGQSQQRLPEIVDAIPEKQFVTLSDEEAAAIVLKRVTVEPLELVLDQAANSVTEVLIDVSGRRDIVSFGRQRAEMKGFSVVKAIPFKGDGGLWFLRPSTFDFNPPHGEVSGSRICIGIQVIERELEQAKSHIAGEIAKINKYIHAQKPTIDQHNAVVVGLANMRVKARRERLIKAADFLKDF